MDAREKSDARFRRSLRREALTTGKEHRSISPEKADEIDRLNRGLAAIENGEHETIGDEG